MRFLGGPTLSRGRLRLHDLTAASVPTSLRALVIGGFTLVAAGMMILTGATIWSQHINRTYAARADMAYRQALLVTRLELAALTAGAAGEAGRERLSATAAQYLATIEEERRLLGDAEPEAAHQAQELSSARRLIDAIEAAGRATGQPADLVQVRAIASDIAAREVAEAARARNDAESVARQTRTLVIAAAGVLLLLPLALMAVLQRQLLVPLRNLGAATRDLALARHGERLEPAGLAEIRALIAHFNAMADAVETRVAERTDDLRRANAELAEVDSRRRLFLAKVSHELRTPVTAIRGEAEVSLRHGVSPDDLREALVHIEQNTMFLQRRLDDLMILARAEDARLPMQPGLVDPFALARKACDVAAAFAHVRNVRIVTELMPPQGTGTVLVPGDPDRLQQAVAAVIDNAIKFSPPGGTVTVSAGIVNGAVVLTIADEGPGVAEAELSRIFDPYVQGSSGRSLGGTGLGLSLARWIVAAHHGTITAQRGRLEIAGGQSAGGEGLCVMLHLPIAG